MAKADKIKRKYNRDRRFRTGERTRVVTFNLWPESSNIELVDRLIDASHVQGARSPLHDRDVYDRNDVEDWLHRHEQEVDLEWTLDELKAKCDAVERENEGLRVPWVGDFKKPHYHYILAFEGNKSLEQVLDLIGHATSYIEKVDTKVGTLKYLIHKNAPEKAQYDFDMIRVFGGMDLSPIVNIGEVERMDYKERIMDAIYAGEAYSWSQLVIWVRKQNDYNLKSELYRNKYLFDGTLMSLAADRAAARKLMGPTPEPLREFERTMWEGAADDEDMDELIRMVELMRERGELTGPDCLAGN